MTATFVGIDIAWAVNKNHSGVAVLKGDSDEVTLVSVAKDIYSQVALVEFVAQQATASTVVAVDASLVVANRTGQRPCETAVAKTFGQYHASCHTTNSNRLYWQTGPNLVRALADYSFVHDFDLDSARQRPGRWLFEVYPHPAMVRLFGLDQIIKYKKGPVAQKRAGLRILQRHLQNLTSKPHGLKSNAALCTLLSQDVGALAGKALKHYEDSLDALFCAYLAWYCWRWGETRNQQFGTLATGYIVVPKAIKVRR